MQSIFWVIERIFYWAKGRAAASAAPAFDPVQHAENKRHYHLNVDSPGIR